MILQRRLAGLAVGLLVALVAAPAFAAGRTTPFDPTFAAAADHAIAQRPQLGVFPQDGNLEPVDSAPAVLSEPSPADLQSLFVPPGHIASAITSIATGNWDAPGTWSGGVVPTLADDVTIADGTTVTVNAPGACASLTVGQGASGILIWDAGLTARTLTVAGNVSVTAGGSMLSPATGTVTTHALSLGGNLTNSGTIDFSTNTNTAGVGITFTGAANATFTGSGSTDLRALTLNKGTSAASILEFAPTSYTVRGSATSTSGYLTITNGMFKLAGTFGGSNPVGAVAGWTIPATGGVWFTNPNYTISAQNGTIILNGALIMDSGTFNVGNSSGNRLAHATGSSVLLRGGAINISGRFSPNSNGVVYNQSGGTMTVTTVDNASSTNAGFEMNSGSSFTMSGGSIVLQKASTALSGPRDYRNLSSTVNITGGTLQIGNASSGVAQTFFVNGAAPAITLTNTSGNHTATQLGEVDAFGPTVLTSGTKLTLNGQLFVERGASITNDGTIDAGVANSALYWFASSPQSYGGAGIAGTVAAPLPNMFVDNLTSLTLSPVSPQIIATRVNMFTGGVVNANRLQLGVGGTSVAVTQIGVGGNLFQAGTYDVAPTFAYGTGGYNLFYSPETVARTTAAEVPASRAINVLIVDNEHDVALAGGDLSAQAVQFPAASKNLTTGASALAVNAGGTLTRANATTSGWVAGNLKKDAPAGNSARAFEIGDATSYAPVAVNLVGVAAPGSLTGRSDSGDLTVPAGSGIDGSKSVNRNWKLSGSLGLSLTSATGTFNFPAAEVDGGANTANFIVRKLDGSTWSSTTAGTRTATSTQATWSSGFSSFAIGEVASYAVNVTTVGSGSVAKDPDQATYVFGSSVDLTATPAAGWHFVGWSGDASGNANPLTVNVDAQKNITATFAINQYAVDVTVVGNGSVTKDPDLALYDHGSSVELTATPAAGWHFVGWTGDVVSAANPVNVTVDAAKAITATFALNQYAVNVSVVGSGSVARDPDQALYDEGSSVELTATPAVGWHFVGWTGDVISAANPVTVTVDAAKAITATFAIDQYAVNVTVVGNGSVAKDPDQALYDEGSNVELTATPAVGWHFVGWTGDVVSAANPVNVSVDAAKNITATFAINQYAVNVTVIGNGSVAKDPDQPAYDYGSNVELTATPAAGWHFVGWTGDVVSAVNPVNVTVDGAKAITATFALNQYPVNVSVVGSGSVAKDPDQALYDEGSNVELTATPAVGWHFVGWTGDVVSAANPVNVTVDAAKNITATFAIDQYAVNVTVVGNGSVAKDPDQLLYDYGSNVELTATPAVGWHFVGWTGDVVSASNPVNVTVDAAKNITATFAIDQFAVNVTVVGSGSVAKDPDQLLYDHGSNVDLTATPAVGWHFVGWTGDVVSVANPVNVTVDGTKNITATFAINQYAVNVSVIGSGSVAKNPDQASYDYGSSVELTATPAVGWHFVGWSGDVISAANPVNVTVDAAKNITATFEINAYTLTINVVGGGAVGANPVQASYDHGSSVQLSPAANPGWSFAGWSGNAGGNANPLTVVMNSNKSITATFVDVALPTAHLLAPNTGGEVMVVGVTQAITWTASDNVGVTSIDLLLSRTGAGGPYEVIASGIPNSGSYDWVATGPGTANGVISVIASDAADNAGSDSSDEPLEIVFASVGVETPVLKFALLPVIPSPSVTSARLRYELPKDAQVDLSIIDVRGREVAKLVHGMQPAGRHAATWNGQTPSGRAPAGVYFARCLSSGARLMQRIVLIR